MGEFLDKEDRQKTLTILRNNIKKHKDSDGHNAALKILEDMKKDTIKDSVCTMLKVYEKGTQYCFQTVYYIAKKNMPYSDFESLVCLQQSKGVNMGHILLSRLSATNIISHVTTEMSKQIVYSIESTTTDYKSVMTVHIKSLFSSSDLFLFYEFD